MKNMDLPESTIFEISNEWSNSDGSISLVFSMNTAFKEWFKNLHNLKRWSDRKFRKVVSDSFKSSGFTKKVDISVAWVENEEG